MSEHKDNKDYNDLAEINLSEAKFTYSKTHIIPKQEISHHKDYILFGAENDYPKQLIDLKNNNAIHNAILTSKAQLIAGSGVEFDTGSTESKKTAKFLKIVNDKDEDINEVLKKLVQDYVLFGGYAFAVTWSKDWTTPMFIEHLDFSKIRVAKPENRMLEVEGYYWAWDWDSYRPKQKIFIPKFNPHMASAKAKERKDILNRYWEKNEELSKEEKEVLKDNNRTQIFYYKDYQPDSYFYPLPEYLGAIMDIEASIEASKYGLAALQNNFDPGFLVKVFKNYDKDAQKQFAKTFYKNYTAAQKAKKPVLMFSKDKDTMPEIEKLDSSDLNKTYLEINKNSLMSIISGHRLTHPLLAGIGIEQKLGASRELEVAYKVFFETVIKPSQHCVLKGINKVLKSMGLETISIVEYNPFFESQTEKEETVNDVEGQEKGNNDEVVDSDEL